MTQDPSRGLRPTWYEIDIGAIAHNVRELRRLLGPGVSLYACMKRNAYGCGIAPVSRACLDAGADGIAVGNGDDAAIIRSAGIEGRILVYPGCLPGSAKDVERLDLMPTISTAEEAVAWDAALTRPRDVFLKVDVGLFRAGAMSGDCDSLFREIKRSRNLHPVGLYSHFFSYGADHSRAHYEWQFKRFAEARAAMARVGLEVPINMVSSTNAVLDFPDMDLTGVDPGRLLFGLNATGSARAGSFRPALSAFKTRLATLKRVGNLPLDGYKPPIAIRDDMVIGVLPLGWGDGLPRRISDEARVLVRGRRVPLLNPLHLEHSRVDLTEVPDAELGDEVVIIGRQGSAEISLSECARWWGIDEPTFHGTMRDHVSRVYF
jgi:alanine racemase